MHQHPHRWLRSLGLATAAMAAVMAMPHGAYAQTTAVIPTVSCSTDPAIFNTGIDGSNGYSINSPKKAWGQGFDDDHWTYSPTSIDVSKVNPVNSTDTNAASALSYSPTKVDRTGAGNGAWVQSPFNNAEWLGAQGQGTPYYIYRYQFNLDPAVDPSTFNLKFDMYTDDHLRRVFVNDQLTNDYSSPGLGVGGYGPGYQVSLLLNSGWKSGLNTLYLLTYNYTDPTGVLVQSTGTAACSPPLYVTKQAVNADGTPFTGKATAGNSMYYDITVTNASNKDASGTVLQDTLPTGLQVTANTWACRVPVGSAAVCPAAAPNNAPLQVTLPTLPAGSSLVYRVSAQFSNPLPTNQPVITNTAEITPPSASGLSCDPRDGFPTPCSSSASVGTAPLVSVTKTAASTGPLYPGDTAVYTVTVRNVGASTVVDTKLSDTLPAGFASATWTCQSPVGSQALCPAASGSMAAGDTLNATIAAMKGGASLVYTITATVDAITSPMQAVVNTALLTATEPDAMCVNPADGTASNSTPCSASATLALWPTPQLALTKTVGSSGVHYAGQTVVYTITAANPGASPVANAKLVDNLPAGLINGSWTCTAGASTPCPAASGTAPLDVSLPTLAPGDTVVFTVSATVAAAPPASVTNTATLDADAKNSQCIVAGAAAGTVPCQASQTIQASAIPGLSVTKTVNTTAPVSPGDALTYTVTVSNSSAADAAQLAIADPAPAHIDLGAWTCTATGAATCPAASGTGAITQAVAVLPAGSGLVYTVSATVNAQAPAATALTNEASVTSAVATTVCNGAASMPCKASATVTTKPAAPVTGGATPVPVNQPWALLALTALLALLASTLRKPGSATARR